MRFPLTLLLMLPCSLVAQRHEEGSGSNDTLIDAELVPVGAHVAGTIGSDGDIDVYSFVLTSNSDLRAWTGPGSGTQVDDTILRLLDASGRELVSVDDGSIPTHGFYSLINVGNLAAGVYYLEVSARPAVTGSYALDLIEAPVGTYVTTQPLTQWFETPEENDPRLNGVASRSGIDSRNLGGIATNRGGGGTSWSSTTVGTEDYDFWTFTVGSDSAITLKTSPGQSGTSVADTVLHLVDAVTMTRLAFDDDGGSASGYSCIVRTLPRGIYFAAVNSFAVGDTGSYVLTIEKAHLVPTSAQASIIIRDGGCGDGNFDPDLSIRGTTSFPDVYTELPILGSTLVIDLTDVPGNATLSVVLDVQSLGSSLIPGTPNCLAELNLNTAVPNLQLATQAGVYHWILDMPLDPTLAGLPLELQIAAASSQVQNAAGVLVSNRVSLICGIGH